MFPRSLNSMKLLILISLVFTSPLQAAFLGLPSASQADRDATLSYITPSYPKTLNPALVSTADEVKIVNTFTVFESLIVTDPDTGEPVCWLCTEYTYDPNDKKIITFKLRDGITFHDGHPATINDVKFSFAALLHPKVDNIHIKSTVDAVVEKVEVSPPNLIKIYFKKMRFNNINTLEDIPIIPQHLFPYFDKNPEQFNKDLKFGRHPIGTGPYRFVKWDSDKFVELERYNEWWGTKEPMFANLFNFKKIKFKFITNDNVAIQAFKKGEFDIMNLASYQFDDLQKDKSSESKVKAQRLDTIISNGFSWIAWNTRQPRFADVKTRKALALLTDRKSTLEKFSKGLRPMTNGPWGINSPYQCPQSKCPVQPFDPPMAKKLLSEAGWGDSDKDGCLDRVVNGEKQVLKFSILASDGDYYKNVLGVYVTEMQKAGVCATIKQLDWSASIKLVEDLNFDAQFSGWQNSHPILPRQLFHSEGTVKTGSNHVGYRDPESDKLIEDYETNFDEIQRQKIAQNLHERIYNAHPAIWHNESGGCFIGRSVKLLGVQVANYSGSCVYWPRWYKAKS